MSTDYLLDLINAGKVDGRPATAQDYADALRAVRDREQSYYQLDDALGEQLAHTVQVLLLAAASRRAPAQALAAPELAAPAAPAPTRRGRPTATDAPTPAVDLIPYMRRGVVMGMVPRRGPAPAPALPY